MMYMKHIKNIEKHHLKLKNNKNLLLQLYKYNINKFLLVN